jgi:predicted kinase
VNGGCRQPGSSHLCVAEGSRFLERRRLRLSLLTMLSMTISIPKLSLVVLIGPSGSGKSTFARKHFLPTEILSSDACRALVSDEENNQAVTNDAFAVLHFIAGKRLALGRLTVIDATNVQRESRKPFVEIARQYHCLPVAIVLNMPEKLCHERNRLRDDRAFGSHVVRQQHAQLRRSLRGLAKEGFRHIFVLETPEEVEAVTIERVPLYNDKRSEHGPFDVIGDVHGCCDELEALLRQLGYEVAAVALVGSALASGPVYAHPQGRKAVFVGDLVDRGPRILDTVRLVRNMMAAGSAFCVPGNHDVKLMRKLRGREVHISHGLAQSLAEIDALPNESRDAFGKDLAEFFDGLISHYVFDNGKLVVAHAGMKAEMQGRAPARFGTLPCMARPPARPTSSVCRCDSTGPRIIAGRRWSSTATRLFRSRNGSTIRLTSTRGVFSAAGSPLCVTRRRSLCRCPPRAPTANRRGRSLPPICNRQNCRRSRFTTTCSTPRM